MVSESEILNAIHGMGVASRPVCLHSSYRSFGPVSGGPGAVIEAFLGVGCTVVVPTFSDGFSVPPPIHLRPKRNGWNYGEAAPWQSLGVGRSYSTNTNEISTEEMGIIPATVLSRPDRVRGDHPLCSFAAVGPMSRSLIAGQTHVDIFAPLHALAQAGGWVVLLGVGLDKMTLVHAAEVLADRRPFVRWANDSDGKPTAVTMGGCSEGFAKLEPALAPLARSRPVGQSQWRAFPATETLEAAAAAIVADPEITRCADPGCERCGDQISGGPIGFE